MFPLLVVLCQWSYRVHPFRICFPAQVILSVIQENVFFVSFVSFTSSGLKVQRDVLHVLRCYGSDYIYAFHLVLSSTFQLPR